MKHLLASALTLTLALTLFLQLPAQSTDGDAIFDVPGIHDIHITFTQPGFWDSLTAYYSIDKMMMAAIDIDGTAMDSVGVQLKGNSSYNSYPGVKKSMNVAFNEYVSQKFDGLKSLNLNNSFKDPTMLREKVMLDFCRRNGVPAPRCTYARVYLNNTLWGLYTVVEQVNKTFLTDRFGDNDGNLFKGDPNGTLQWQGASPSLYYNRYELKTNETANDWTDLVHLIDEINNTPAAQFADSLARVLDPETFIGVWASNMLFANLDSYQGSGHNYYIYHDTTEDRFKFITWDVNEAFGNFQMGIGYPAIQTMSAFYVPGPSGSRPLTSNMLANAGYHAAYVDRLCQMATYDFTVAHMEAVIDSLAGVVRADVYADPNKMYTDQQFETNLDDPVSNGPMGQIPGLKGFVGARRAALESELAGFGCSMVVGSAPAMSGDVQIWPNPNRGLFSINASAFITNLTIYNIYGNQILKYQINNSQWEPSSSFPAGVYLWKTTFLDGTTNTGKFIVY